jgi:hypothetical protein
MSGILKSGGETSSMRIALIICVVGSLVIAGAGVWLDRDLIGLSALVSPFLFAGIGGKAYQKGKE